MILSASESVPVEHRPAATDSAAPAHQAPDSVHARQGSGVSAAMTFALGGLPRRVRAMVSAPPCLGAAPVTPTSAPRPVSACAQGLSTVPLAMAMVSATTQAMALVDAFVNWASPGRTAPTPALADLPRHAPCTAFVNRMRRVAAASAPH